VAVGLEIDQLFPRPLDPCRPFDIGESHDAVGIADIETVISDSHAERLVQPIQKHLADVSDTIAIRIPE